MKKQLSLIFLSILLINCKQSVKLHEKINEKEALKLEDEKLIKEENIDDFLNNFKHALNINDDEYIKMRIVFPFEHKSGGEIVDVYNSYEEIKTNIQFKIIAKAHYSESCSLEENKIKHYCITYFDDNFDMTFYAIKKDKQFKFLRVETPN